MIPKKFQLFYLRPDRKRVELVHPKYGPIDSYIVIELSNKTRTSIESHIDRIPIKSGHVLMEVDALMAASIIVDWDEELFKEPCTFDAVLNKLNDPELKFIMDAALNAHLELEQEFILSLIKCFNTIEHFWESQVRIGGSTKEELFKRMEFNYKKGYLTAENKKEFEKLKAEREAKGGEAFVPDPIVSNAYTSYFNMRNTISYDRLLNHQDIVNYSTSIGKDITPIELNAILKLDNKFMSCRMECMNKTDKYSQRSQTSKR